MLENKNHSKNNSDKRAWHVRDVFIAIVISVVVLVLAHWILKFLSFLHPIFIDYGAGFIGVLVAIYLLNQKYPLQLSSKLNLNDIFKYVLPAVFFCLLFGGFPYFVYFGHLENLPNVYNSFVRFNIIEKFFLLVFVCLIGPITEEIFDRGFVYRIIKNRYNIFFGTIISTGLFYAFHGSHSLSIIISSLIFTYVYQKTGNIWNSIIVHSLNNTLWFVFVYWGVKLQTGN